MAFAHTGSWTDGQVLYGGSLTLPFYQISDELNGITKESELHNLYSGSWMDTAEGSTVNTTWTTKDTKVLTISSPHVVLGIQYQADMKRGVDSVNVGTRIKVTNELGGVIETDYSGAPVGDGTDMNTASTTYTTLKKRYGTNIWGGANISNENGAPRNMMMNAGSYVVQTQYGVQSGGTGMAYIQNTIVIMTWIEGGYVNNTVFTSP